MGTEFMDVGIELAGESCMVRQSDEAVDGSSRGKDPTAAGGMLELGACKG